jgi:hypothetical protein
MKQSLLGKAWSWEVMAAVAQKVLRDVATAAEPETVNAFDEPPLARERRKR